MHSERAAGQTTDATALTVLTIPLADNTAYWITVRSVGRQTDNTNRAAYFRMYRAFRSGGGAADVSTSIVSGESESDASWTTIAVASGNDVLVTVAGAAGQTVEWEVFVEWQSEP